MEDAHNFAGHLCQRDHSALVLPMPIRLAAAVLIILWVSAIASAFIDNIPYTATMIPVVMQIAHDLNIDLSPERHVLQFVYLTFARGVLVACSTATINVPWRIDDNARGEIDDGRLADVRSIRESDDDA